MKILRDLADVPAAARGGAVSIGNFDGVHLGHARIMQQLAATARQVEGPAVVFTFDPHPVRILRPQQCPPPLTWTERKAELLRELGIDWLVVYPTDEQLLELEPEPFFDLVVRHQLGARAVVEGSNFCFGRARMGTIERLGELAAAAGVRLEVVPPYTIDGLAVSSSRIRGLVSAGRAEEAAAMLTAPYRIRGMVTHGAGRGAKLGFPTANLDAIDTLLPADGVYAGRAWLERQSWPAAINIGPNPTFKHVTRKVEAHLIGTRQELYGRPLEVDFRARLRDIQPFPSAAALRDQLAKDVQRARQVAAGSTRIRGS